MNPFQKIYLTMVLIPMSFCGLTAQELVASYPLRVEKQISNKIWFKHYGHDISGNGKHGAWSGDHWRLNWDGGNPSDIDKITYKLTGSSEQYKLQGWFPLDQTGSIVPTANTRFDFYPEGYQNYGNQGVFITNSLEKGTTDNVFLAISDPYEDWSTFPEFINPGATVTFWIKYKAANFPSGVKVEVLSVPWFELIIDGQNLEVQSGSSGYSEPIFTGSSDGWYFVSVVMKQNPIENSKTLVQYHYNHYDPTFTEATDIISTTLKEFTLTRSGTSGNILSQNFKGGLRDVAFFHDLLNEVDVKKVRNENWLVSQKRNGELSNTIFDKTAAYSNSLNGTATDRFGNANSATQDANISISGDPFDGYDAKKGYTVSFWAQKTSGEHDFYSVTGSGMKLAGAGKRNESDLGVYRYFPSDQKNNNLTPKSNPCWAHIE